MQPNFNPFLATEQDNFNYTHMKKFNLVLLLVAYFLGLTPNLQAQKDTSATALLLIDIQYFYFAGGRSELYQPNEAALNAKRLLDQFRASGKLVVHVRHEAKEGSEIHETVKPLSNEKVFTKTEVNCFNGTDLLQFLRDKGIKKIVICGMQTQMCVEAAVRAAYDYGFECVLVQDACASRDLRFGEYIIKATDVHYSTLSTLKSYGKVLSTDEFLK